MVEFIKQTLTPDNLRLALTTPDGDEIQVVDYAARYADMPLDELRVHAKDFIVNRKAKLESYVLMSFSAMLELGAAFELTFNRLPHGEFAPFVAECGFRDVDTIRHYRNTYRHFAELLADVPEQALQSLNWRILYRLATRTVAESCREWFVNFISATPEAAGDERLIEITKYLPVELRARLDRTPPELNIEQAYSLALAYKRGLDAYIYRLVIDYRVKDGYIASELNRLYLEMSAVAMRDKDAAAQKSFADIMRHEYRLVWFDTESGDNDVALSDATKDTIIRYLAARRRDKFPMIETRRVTGSIRRLGDAIYLRIDKASTLPLDYDNGDEILVDLLIQNKRERLS